MSQGTFSVRKRTLPVMLIMILAQGMGIGGLILPHFQVNPEYIAGTLVFIMMTGMVSVLLYYLIFRAPFQIEISAKLIQLKTLRGIKTYQPEQIEKIQYLGMYDFICIDILLRDKMKIRVTNKELSNFENFVSFCHNELKNITD